MSNVPMTRSEEALAQLETTHGFAATFVERADGRILQLTGTLFTTSDDGGLTWSEPFQCHDTNGDLVGDGGMSLVRLSGNGIGLAAVRHTPSEAGSRSQLLFWRSDDGGQTWAPPATATPEGLNSSAYHDTMIRTSSGRLILPVYCSMGQQTAAGEGATPRPGKLFHGQWVETNAHFFDRTATCSYVCYSDDEGRTWQRNKDGELIVLLDGNAIFSYTNEPSVAEVEPGKLLLFLRTGLGRVFQAWSSDNGETWTRPAPTSLATSTAPAKIRTLPTGHLLAVWNQQSEAEIKQGYIRSRISSAVSRNGGSVWEFFQNVTSLHEETRVEPGPIRPVRPAEHYLDAGIAGAGARGRAHYTRRGAGHDDLSGRPGAEGSGHHCPPLPGISRAPDPRRNTREQSTARNPRVHSEAEGVAAALVLRRQRAGGKSVPPSRGGAGHTVGRGVATRYAEGRRSHRPSRPRDRA